MRGGGWDGIGDGEGKRGMRGGVEDGEGWSRGRG